MRFVPSSPASWFAATAGAVLAAGALFVGCSVFPLGGETEEPTSAEASPTPSPSIEEALFALPESCADIGAAELVGDLAPEGSVLEETTDQEVAAEAETEEPQDVASPEQLSCVWQDANTTELDSASFTLVFTVNVDPSDKAAVVRLPGELEEMNWEVDVDVDVDTYHTAEADRLGGELKYVSTVEGSSKQLYLSLPGNFHVSVITMFSDADKEDMERVLITAAEQARK